MSVRLFNLRGVPEDEAKEIRELLTKNNIDFYETPPSKWGISGAIIWLKDEVQLEKAKQLITAYQVERTHRARKEYEQLKREGKNITITDKVKQEPLKMLFYMALILLVLYLSITPFIIF